MGKFSKIFPQCCGSKNDDNDIEESNERKWNGAQMVDKLDTNPRITIKTTRNPEGEIKVDVAEKNENDVHTLMHTVIPNSNLPPKKKPRQNSTYPSW